MNRSKAENCMSDDMSNLARDPRHRREFEKLLRLAARRGDADLVAERLGWGIDPDCRSAGGGTPLIANIRGYCPSAATVRALLKAGADPSLTDRHGLSALDYARRKLARLQAKPRGRPRKSPSLDENNQLKLSAEERSHLDELRAQIPAGDRREFVRIWWQERLRAARRVFNDPDQVELIVSLLEAVEGEL
jgi:hypothetical protein